MSTTPQGIDIVVRAATQQAASAFGLLQGFVQGVGIAVANFAGRAARALGEMSGQALHTADEMGKLAQKTGTATERISALAYAAKLSDVGIGELEVGIKGLSQWMERTGIIGRDVIEVMLEQADAFAGMADGAAKTNLAMEVFGGSGRQMIPLLNQGSQAIRGLMEEARRLGVVIGSETARNAETFNDRLTVMKTLLEGIAIRFTSRSLESLLKLTDLMLAIADKSGPVVEVLEVVGAFFMGKWVDEVSYVTAGLVAVSEGLIVFFKAVTEGASIAEAASRAYKEFGSSLAGIIAAVAKYRAERQKANEEDNNTAGALPKLVSAYDTLAQQLKDTALIAESSSGKKRIDALQEELRLLDKMKARAGLANQMAGQGMMLYTEEGLKAAQKLLEIEQAREQVQRDLDSMSFSGRLQQEAEAMGTAMQQLADTTTGVVRGAFDSVADGLSNLILGTRTWGQALSDIGTSILNGVVRSIIGMGTQWIATQTLMAVAGKAVMASAVAAASPFAAASAAMWAPAATLATIATYGSAAVAAPGFILGANLLTKVESMGQAVAGFADGGAVSGPGTWFSDSILARLSNDEYVVRAPAALSVGHDRLDEINRTGRLPNDGSSGEPVVINLAVFGDEAAAQRWADSKEGSVWFWNRFRESFGKFK
ncbi:MAG: hypothetical protein KIT22_08865 [Verrucomicrobiae bacterium]|nr:hypothetical protein [Verrucomicrobiae bacterium]